MIERFGAVKSGDKPLTVVGEPLEVGDRAPDFILDSSDFSKVTLADSAGKVRLLSVVPSLATSICDQQTRRFDLEANNFSDEVVFITISTEHPINQKSWCSSAEVENVQVLSDHRDMNFGIAYGTYVKEMRLEQRSIFVIDKNDRITYIEYVPIIGQHPDYDKALNAVTEALG